MDDFRLGKQIKHLSQALRNYFVENYAKELPDGLVGHEGAVIGYLFTHQDKKITLNDIVVYFDINKSSASEMLSKLSSAGFIDFAVDPSDKRKKIISLTEKGKAHQQKAKKVFDAFEKDISSGLSEQELAQAKSIIAKIKTNLGGKSNA